MAVPLTMRSSSATPSSVSWMAKATGSPSMPVPMLLVRSRQKSTRASISWAAYYSTEHSLGTTYQTFTFTFTINLPNDENARVEFDPGLSDVDVHIDNVEVVSMP